MSAPKRRVRIQWTDEAIKCLQALPKKVQRGLVAKAEELESCTSEPECVHKPLAGPLQGFYRITYARYRAIYWVDRDKIANGDELITITVTFIAAGKRAEHSRDDVYKVAQKLVELGIIDVDGDDDEDDEDPPEQTNPER